jgi:hypothetical protein
VALSLQTTPFTLLNFTKSIILVATNVNNTNLPPQGAAALLAHAGTSPGTSPSFPLLLPFSFLPCLLAVPLQPIAPPPAVCLLVDCRSCRRCGACTLAMHATAHPKK